MTEPLLPMMTGTSTVPRYPLVLRGPQARRRRGRIHAFFAAIVSFINTLLAMALALTLLLLFARFLLNWAHLTFPYSSWLLQLSAPLVAPIGRYLPLINVARYTIDLPTLATMLAALLAVLFVRGMLKKLVGK
jgi:ABC-type antimicrobial peptide transport system permease subunit